MKFHPDLEKYRETTGRFRSPAGSPFGKFHIPVKNMMFTVVADYGGGDTTGWEHVSVSLKNRTPNWEEMCAIKNLFWDEDETVMQFHPKKTEYVNLHPHCLHLWRKVGEEPELPPAYLVGPVGVGPDATKEEKLQAYLEALAQYIKDKKEKRGEVLREA